MSKFLYWREVWTSCDKVWTDNKTCIPPDHGFQHVDEKIFYQSNQLRGVVAPVDLRNYFVDSPIEQYFYKRFLDQDFSRYYLYFLVQYWINLCYFSLKSFVTIRGETGACLFVVWMVSYFCIWKRRKTTQISRQIQLMIFCILIIATMIKICATSKNLGKVPLFIQPKMEDLLNPAVWICSLGYVCNLFGLGFGVPMELAASNAFNYRHLIKDVITIIIISIIFSFIVETIIVIHASEIAASKVKTKLKTKSYF